MDRFFSRIQEKALCPGDPPVLIVAFGDSVTQGVMEDCRLDSQSVYHRIVQERLEQRFPATTFSTINAGVSGETIDNASKRLHRDVIAHHPDLVLVAFGLNDCLSGGENLARFSEALRRSVSEIQTRTGADMVLLTPPFMAMRLSPRIHPNHLVHAEKIILRQNDGTLAEYAKAIRKVAEETGCKIADVHREWELLHRSGLDTDLWLVNGLNHPDARGHLLAAETVVQALLSERRRG